MKATLHTAWHEDGSRQGGYLKVFDADGEEMGYPLIPWTTLTAENAMQAVYEVIGEANDYWDFVGCWVADGLLYLTVEGEPERDDGLPVEKVLEPPEPKPGEHTPGEWYYKDKMISSEAHPHTIATLNHTGRGSTPDADGEFIVRAVNSHDALREACADAVQHFATNSKVAQKLRAAIALATKEI